MVFTYFLEMFVASKFTERKKMRISSQKEGCMVHSCSIEIKGITLIESNEPSKW